MYSSQVGSFTLHAVFDWSLPTTVHVEDHGWKSTPGAHYTLSY